jgi:hypothetical protein
MVGRKYNYGAVALAVLAAVLSAGSGKISNPTPYDPVLQGPPQGSCDPNLASPDVVGGVDVNGNPVTSADLEPSQIPDAQVEVRTPNGDKVYVDAGKMNRPPACPASSR